MGEEPLKKEALRTVLSAADRWRNPRAESALWDLVNRLSLVTVDRVVPVSNGDVVSIPRIRPRLDQGSLIHMQGFIISLSFFFFCPSFPCSFH